MNYELAHYITVPFTTLYGSVGTGYTNVLIAENGKIKSIGQYLYRIDKDLIPVSEQLTKEFGEACEQYRLGLGKYPHLCYNTISGQLYVHLS